MSGALDKILTRIRKLAALTLENGASEAEAKQAGAHIARLLAEHNLSLSEIDLRADQASCKQDMLSVDLSVGREWTGCCNAIAFLCDCKAYGTIIKHPLGDEQAAHFFGYPQDVEAALTLARICARAINGKGWAFQKAEGKLAACDYRKGMANRLAERIHGLKAAPLTGTGLIVLKGQLVTEEFAKLNLRLGKERASTIRNRGAYSAGQETASNINLERAKYVSGTRQIGAS